MSARAAALCALAAAGCAVDGSRDVAQYRGLLDGCERRTLELQPDAAVDLALAMRLANARSEELDIAGEVYVRSLVDRRRAASVWLPQAELAPGYYASDAAGGVQDGFDVPLGITLSTNPKADQAAVERADAEVMRVRALLFAVQDALLLDVARTLLEIVRSERSAVVLRNSLQVQDARVEDSRARREAGVGRPIDVSLSESRAAATRVDLLEAERRAREGRVLLSFLANAPLGEAPLDGALAVPDELPELGRLVERARERRPEVAAASAAVLSAERGVEVATGQWWPTVSLSLDVFLARDSQPTDQDWRGLLSATLPLFTAGRIRDDVRTALSFARSAQHTLSLARRAVARDVEVAARNVDAARERIAELGVQLVAARAASDQAESLYDAGLGTNLERLAAQEQTLNAELALENADQDLRVGWLDLLRATGELHELIGAPRPPLRPAEGGAHAEAR